MIQTLLFFLLLFNVFLMASGDAISTPRNDVGISAPGDVNGEGFPAATTPVDVKTMLVTKTIPQVF